MLLYSIQEWLLAYTITYHACCMPAGMADYYDIRNDITCESRKYTGHTTCVHVLEVPLPAVRPFHIMLAKSPIMMLLNIAYYVTDSPILFPTNNVIIPYY